MAIVTFDSDEFLAIYPRFAGVLTPAQLQNAFDVACLVLDNSEGSIVPFDPANNVDERLSLIHI